MAPMTGVADVGYSKGADSQESFALPEMTWEKLPEDVGKASLHPATRGKPEKYANEVKATFSRFPQLCHKVGNCSHCAWRLKRLNLISDLTKHERFVDEIEATTKDVTFDGGDNGMIVDDQTGIVMDIRLDSPAALKGVQVGFRIQSVDGRAWQVLIGADNFPRSELPVPGITPREIDLGKKLCDAEIVASAGEYNMSFAVEANVVVFFQAIKKPMGMKVKGNTVSHVSRKGQAYHEGVKDGWRITSVDGRDQKDAPIDKLLEEAFAEAQKTKSSFQVTLDREMELVAFHDGDSDGLTVVQDQAPVHDMLKIRGLFNLLPAPPRRERRHKDATVVNLAGIQPPLDMHRFLVEPSHPLSEFQIRRFSEILAHVAHVTEDGKVSHATCSKRDFENAIARSGLQHRLTHRKVGLAFLRILELDRQNEERKKRAEERAEELRMTPRASMTPRRASLMIRSSSLASMASSTDSKMSRASALASRAKEKNLANLGKLSHRELRRKLTSEWLQEEEEREEKSVHESDDFHIISWWRACEQCTVQLDCRIEVNEDVEWTFAIYDTLDMKWPWKPIIGPEDEDCVDDERGKIFRGLFLGITTPPFTSSPKVRNSSLIGCRARDGVVLHRGNKLTEEECGIPAYLPIKKPEDGPAIVTLRLDRRRFRHDAYNTKTYASRLWIQRVVGFSEKYEDKEAQLLIDNIGLAADTIAIPVIYANSPVNDVAHSVKLWNCSDASSLGMRMADRTIGAKHSYRHAQEEALELRSRKNTDDDEDLSPSRSRLSPSPSASRLESNTSFLESESES